MTTTTTTTTITATDAGRWIEYDADGHRLLEYHEYGLVRGSVVLHRGRWWLAECADGQWTAPTPSIGGAYRSRDLDYVCSGAAVSYSRLSAAKRAAIR